MPAHESFNPALKYQLKSNEQLPVKIWQDAKEGAVHIARSIALAIRQKQQDGEHIVLGLATGSSPIKVYEELVRMHREERLSFHNVVTFNLDEYYPMAPEAQQSYVRFMREYLFDHIDIPKENIHIPDGTLPIHLLEEYCRQYENRIEDFGGIDIQLLGIGRTGHIGFNEPGSWENSPTRLVRLDSLTRRDAVKDFQREELVPYRALTMGIGTIMKARAIYLMAWGSHKAAIVQEAVEGPVSAAVPATYLQKHPNTKVYVDLAAAQELTRFKAPWLVGMCHWDDDLICKAVVWLSQKTGKPILKLTDEDYSEHNLSELIIEQDNSYNINIKVFNRLQHTITGWPGGKPNADDTHRPERAEPVRKRVLIFSPHPDDDVISMGGTFLRLVEQGHEVHVAYQTSGNIAVHDYDALRFMEFYKEFDEAACHPDPGHPGEGPDASTVELYNKVVHSLKTKQPDESDIPEVRRIKGLIRRGEARAGARFCGLTDEYIHFLDLPFYETGRARKNPHGEKDIQIIMDLMQEIKPHQVYAAGDLADPHGTHRVCLDAIFEAFHRLQGKSWMEDCWLWLYRGAWHEWSVDEIEMAVPLSPQQLEKKRRAIFMHQSQKDQPPFPGEDTREFWQRAEDRNRNTARLYRALGLAEYEAMEAFRRWRG
jgi:glucosamine-6-phosphate deaminase